MTESKGEKHIPAMMTSFFSNAITNINMYYSGVYAAEVLNLNSHQLGIASSISTIVTQISQPVWGVLSDWRNVRKYFAAIGYLIMGLMVSITFKLQTFMQYILITSFAWAFWAGAYTCWQALIGDITTKRGRGKFLGALGFAGNLGGMISSLLAGQIIDLYGYELLSSLCLVFAVFSAIPLIIMKEKKNGVKAAEKKGMKWKLTMTREYKRYLAVGIGWWGIMSMAWPLFSIMQIKVFNLTKTEIGILYLTGSAVNTILSPIWGIVADRIGRKPLLLISPIFSSFWTFAYGFSENYFQILILSLIGNVGGSALTTISNIYLLDTIMHREQRATLISIYNMATGLSQALGQYIGGVLGSVLGLKETMILAGILRLIYIVPMLVLPETIEKKL